VGFYFENSLLSFVCRKVSLFGSIDLEFGLIRKVLFSLRCLKIYRIVYRLCGFVLGLPGLSPILSFGRGSFESRPSIHGGTF
jgi:hypothetical protein